MFKKHIYFTLALAFIAVFGFAGTAHANPSVFGTATSTNSAATTSPVYQAVGLATSTIVYDAYAPTGGSIKYKADKLIMLNLFQGSSTLSTLVQQIEYSQDGIDWFRSNVFSSESLGTTTQPVNLSTPISFTMKFASSTVGGIGITTANSTFMTSAIIIPTPLRYTRLITGCTGANCTSWSTLIPMREQI